MTNRRRGSRTATSKRLAKALDVIMSRRKGRTVLPPAEASDEELLAWHKASCSWPNLYYSSTIPYLRAIGAKRVAEVGVAYGYHAETILAGVEGVCYVGVDPYLAGYDDSDVFARDVAQLFMDDPQSSMNRLYAAVKSGLSNRHSGRAQIIRAGSGEATHEFPDSCFDAVFIDGDHRFESVLQDLHAWWPKIRPGGSILGDDYQRDSVAAAWEEFLSLVDGDSFFLENHVSGYRTVVAVK